MYKILRKKGFVNVCNIDAQGWSVQPRENVKENEGGNSLTTTTTAGGSLYVSTSQGGCGVGGGSVQPVNTGLSGSQTGESGSKIGLRSSKDLLSTALKENTNCATKDSPSK